MQFHSSVYTTYTSQGPQILVQIINVFGSLTLRVHVLIEKEKSTFEILTTSLFVIHAHALYHNNINH